MSETFTQKERIKVACLSACIASGKTLDEITADLSRATDFIRKAQGKQAAWSDAPGSIAGSLGKLGLGLAVVGVPVAALAGGWLGRVAGTTARNIQVGRLPTTDELKLLDELAVYNRTADEIEERTRRKKKEREESRRPSVRRMF